MPKGITKSLGKSYDSLMKAETYLLKAEAMAWDGYDPEKVIESAEGYYWDAFEKICLSESEVVCEVCSIPLRNQAYERKNDIRKIYKQNAWKEGDRILSRAEQEAFGGFMDEIRSEIVAPKLYRISGLDVDSRRINRIKKRYTENAWRWGESHLKWAERNAKEGYGTNLSDAKDAYRISGKLTPEIERWCGEIETMHHGNVWMDWKDALDKPGQKDWERERNWKEFSKHYSAWGGNPKKYKPISISE